jgi:aerobic-type carbon monoxide dehydrogenase small subunit (CoxS/CutS family)
MRVEIILNGVRRGFEIEPGDTLLELLRREGYKGVKKGCETGDCGACAVLLDGRAVNSCLVLAAKADGRTVTTVEGLEADGRLSVLQEAFLDAGAVQCGYCTPGMLIAATDLLNRNPHPSEEEIREAISGNLCRCTGYVKQVEAIELAVRRMEGKDV